MSDFGKHGRMYWTGFDWHQFNEVMRDKYPDAVRLHTVNMPLLSGLVNTAEFYHIPSENLALAYEDHYRGIPNNRTILVSGSEEARSRLIAIIREEEKKRPHTVQEAMCVALERSRKS